MIASDWSRAYGVLRPAGQIGGHVLQEREPGTETAQGSDCSHGMRERPVRRDSLPVSDKHPARFLQSFGCSCARQFERIARALLFPGRWTLDKGACPADSTHPVGMLQNPRFALNLWLIVVH